MNDIPAWIDLIEVRRVRGYWEARLIGDRETSAWHRIAGTTNRDSINGVGDTPDDAIADAIRTPGAYETTYQRDQR